MNYGRLRYFPRTFNTPATVPIQGAPDGTGKGKSFPYPLKWVEQCAKWNSPKAQQKLFQPHAFLVNTENTGKNGEPIAEMISMSGNIVAWEKVENNHYNILSFLRGEDPQSILGIQNINWQDYPHLVVKAGAISPTGVRSKIGAGLDIYYALLTESYNAWVDASQVEPFPILPAHVKIDAFWGLKIRAGYGIEFERTGYYPVGTAVDILEYRSRGAEVWGRTSDGWICLQNNSLFYTSWRMSTLPPLP